MEERTWRARLMSLVILTVAAVSIWLTGYTEAPASSAEFSVSFLDVGQGDAILIETPGGTQVLVDGGADAGVLRELAAELPLFDSDIDMVVATHPDTDHIGGLVDVLERYDIGQILITENKGESAAARAFAGAAADEGAEIAMARRGQVWHLDASTTLAVLFPETDVSEMENNAASIVVQITYGDTSFLLTGDSPKRIEEYLVLAEGENLQSTVLKVGHHGSRTSTSELFLEEVDPEYAVISAGADNRYGHPHVEVTDMLFNHRIETLNTAEEGTITFVSDGKAVWVE